MAQGRKKNFDIRLTSLWHKLCQEKIAKRLQQLQYSRSTFTLNQVNIHFQKEPQVQSTIHSTVGQ